MGCRLPFKGRPSGWRWGLHSGWQRANQMEKMWVPSERGKAPGIETNQEECKKHG